MSIYHKSQPVAINQFRDNTAKGISMPNVTTTPARDKCNSCGRMRTVITGQYNKLGEFTCGMCGNPRRVA